MHKTIIILATGLLTLSSAYSSGKGTDWQERKQQLEQEHQANNERINAELAEIEQKHQAKMQRIKQENENRKQALAQQAAIDKQKREQEEEVKLQAIQQKNAASVQHHQRQMSILAARALSLMDEKDQQYQLGQDCYNGTGTMTRKDPAKGFIHYQKAAELGHKDAQFNLKVTGNIFFLGNKYYSEGRFKDARYQLKRAAERGHPTAMEMLPKVEEELTRN